MRRSSSAFGTRARSVGFTATKRARSSSSFGIGRLFFELAVPPAKLADRTVAVAEHRLLAEQIVLPDLNVVFEAAFKLAM